MFEVRFASSPLLRRTAVAFAVLVSGAAAHAADVFTLNPGAAGLNGSTVTADNIVVTDYAVATITGSSFQEHGYLSFSSLALNGVTQPAGGLNSTYGLYIEFFADGMTDGNNPLTGPTTGQFNNLTYTLYGYNGAPAAFTVTNTAATKSATTDVVLATGNLVSGVVGTQPYQGKYLPSAFADLAFNVTKNPALSGFFASPSTFYNIASAGFTNNPQTVTAFAGGFSINGGGGNVTFTSAVPEPETYALMLAGLGAVAFVARRRRG